LIERVTATVEC